MVGALLDGVLAFRRAVDCLGCKKSPIMPLKKGKKKKKGGAKKKVNKAEKAKEKLEKACELMTSQTDLYQNFLDRMDRWIVANKHKAVELFKRFDRNGDGVLTYDEFKSGMLDLDAPCNALELHVLAKRLDKDKNETIDYVEFSKGLSFCTDEEETDGTEKHPPLEITKEVLEECPSCKLGLWKPYAEKYPKYVYIYLKFVTFDNLRSYPGHFSVIVHSHLTVFGLLEIIKERTDLGTTKLRIFSDKSRDASCLLLPDKTLEQCGIQGGTRSKPEETVLYYDYSTEFHDCPLLMSDHYFMS
ncbi:uncharacterized protein LOC110986092 isoform X3 [Acanthaster planci]|uniref:Uncharacterized protein LOC110986092 isoform X3 n=1 Tax=Acanthaster planci TaxID=133434 RepID=A0A8B7ZEJ1_ACAPL|nr:uncharacterized protein LOC110986092 isoform X3 [Acanthaster planci]XP_022103411.1 uncharacterized protein LOC110986092 isoform X3 [Acanthaster planci]XP_022103412.1 uncharacterized protein LOC110986092 isoform X3 [Acanthaster planci]